MLRFHGESIKGAMLCGAELLSISALAGGGRPIQKSPFFTIKWAIEGLANALAQRLPQGMASLILICYALLLEYKLTIFLPPRNGLQLQYLGDSTLALALSRWPFANSR